jgi:hypothetical protein
MAAPNETPRESDARMTEEARGAWNDAKDMARSAAGAQQEAAARGLDQFAGALRDAARNAGGGEATTSRVAETVADGLDRLSSTLKSRDISTLVRDVEDFARSQPLVFFGAAVAAGFIAMRFLKSSEPVTETGTGRTGSWRQTDAMKPVDSSRSPANPY